MAFDAKYDVEKFGVLFDSNGNDIMANNNFTQFKVVVHMSSGKYKRVLNSDSNAYYCIYSNNR